MTDEQKPDLTAIPVEDLWAEIRDRYDACLLLTSRMEHKEETRGTFFHGGLSQTTGLAHLYIADATHHALQTFVAEDDVDDSDNDD